MRFLFFYLMAEDTDRVGEVAPRHAAYWHRLAPPAYLGGPFADRSGGLITFEADTPAQAEQLVTDDPFLREGTVSSWWLKQWLAEGADPATSPAGER
ncbi:MAG TPA: YciI family protein [Jiangellaceae bacterium]|jgi:hypothetical protein